MIVIAVPLVVLAAAAVNGVVASSARLRLLAPALLVAWVACAAANWVIADTEKVHFDRLASAIAARHTVPSVVFAESYTEGAPLAWIAKARTPGVAVRMVSSVSAVDADAGWIVWSEANPPRGVPPAAALIRRGFLLGVPVFDRGMRDSVVALPFERTRRP
jgi:hypothetical protein